MEPEIVTPSTVLSERPPTEPILRPWPPSQTPPVKAMVVPELTARQSSWFRILALEIVTPVEEPTSKASVLWPSETPFLLFIVMLSTVRVVAPLMDISWTGESLNVRPEMEDFVRECA